MNTFRILILAAAAALISPLTRAAVSEYNNSSCCNKVVVVKQYNFYNSVLQNCPTFEVTISCGSSLSISDYYESDQYHTFELRNETQYTYTVAASCAPSVTISSTTLKAPISQRTRIGVGEVVTVTVSPASASTWYVTSGVGTLSNPSSGQVTLTAGDTASTNLTVTATVNGSNYSKTFTVVAPSGVFAERQNSTGVFHQWGQPSAGMKLWLYVLPDDVNFENVYIQEGCSDVVANGYFLYQNNNPTYAHTPGAWNKVSYQPIAGKGSVFSNDTAQGGSDNHTPYITGNFTWTIPYSYKVGASGTERGPFTSVNQTKSITSTGAMTVTKGAASVTTQLNDPTTSY